MSKSKIFRKGSEKSLLPYLLKGFKHGLADTKMSKPLSWVSIDPSLGFDLKRIYGSIDNATIGICIDVSSSQDGRVWLENNYHLFKSDLLSVQGVRFCVNVSQFVQLAPFFKNRFGFVPSIKTNLVPAPAQETNSRDMRPPLPRPATLKPSEPKGPELEDVSPDVVGPEIKKVMGFFPGILKREAKKG